MTDADRRCPTPTRPSPPRDGSAARSRSSSTRSGSPTRATSAASGLGLRGDDAVRGGRRGAARDRALADGARPSAACSSSRWRAPGVELIVGHAARPAVRSGRRSSGSAGSSTEVLDDVAIRLAPLDRADAPWRCSTSSAARRLLDGVRGAPAGRSRRGRRHARRRSAGSAVERPDIARGRPQPGDRRPGRRDRRRRARRRSRQPADDRRAVVLPRRRRRGASA